MQSKQKENVDMRNDQVPPRSGLTQELPGAPAESKSDKYGRLAGYALIACGLIFNEWVVGLIVSPDGKIDLVQVREAIWLFDALLILAGVIIVRRPIVARWALSNVMLILSLVTCSFVIYATLELFPSLIKYMPFANVQYYAERARYVNDDELAYKPRPFFSLHTESFKGDRYRDSNGVDVKPMSYSVTYDQDGFRNGPMPRTGWDVAVLGDSFIEFGVDESDTFTSRFAALTGLTVRNLGVAGYGPFQYVAVLRKYGLTSKPKYALFCFFEGNDIAGINHYLQWQNGKRYGALELAGKNFFQRYVMALTDVLYVPVAHALEGESTSSDDSVTIKLGDASIKTDFSYKSETRPPNEILKMREWIILKDLLGQFKSISSANGIVPIVVFIPTTAHIYAQYSTPASGAPWMAIRDQQIAAKDHAETALRILCQEVGVELISLSPSFERAASEGKLVFYPFDTHWNSEGRQIAASVLAETLRSREEFSRARDNLRASSPRPLSSFK